MTTCRTSSFWPTICLATSASSAAASPCESPIGSWNATGPCWPRTWTGGAAGSAMLRVLAKGSRMGLDDTLRPMTEPIYHHDAYVKGFEAQVVEVSEDGVALDRSAFFPG